MTSEDARAVAVDRAYRDHAVDVYRVAYGILGDADEAVDATQDAFARAWERWEQYDNQRSLRAWLHGIVVHLALDQLRRRRVRRLAAPRLAQAAGSPQPSSGTEDPESDVVRRRTVEDALATLRPEARATLVLRHYYGYDYAQIGSFLGVAAGTVGSTLTRAHAVLRECLGEPGQGSMDPPRPAARPSPEPAGQPPEVHP